LLSADELFLDELVRNKLFAEDVLEEAEPLFALEDAVIDEDVLLPADDDADI
jgi:hypothetical protein